MPKSQLSISDQIGLTLGTLLFFSLIAIVAGYMSGGETRQKMAAFAAEPVTAAGTITHKHIDSVRPTAGGTWVYWLDVSFKLANGATRNQSIEVANTIYDRYDVGGPVSVTYVKSKPGWFYIPGAEPTARDVGFSDAMFEYGAIASAFFLVAFLGWLFTRTGGGAPAAPRIRY